jgi:hypothetical protein
MINGPMLWGMEVGDIATWVSGIASLAAVGVSLGLAWRANVRAEDDRKKAEAALVRILSAQAQKPIVAAAASLGVVRDFLARLAEGKVHGKPEVLLTVRGQEGLSNLVQRASDIQGIPLDVLETVVTFDMAVSTYNGMVGAIIPMIQNMSDGDAEEGAELERLLRNPFQAVRDAARDTVTALGRHSTKIADLGRMWALVD